MTGTEIKKFYIQKSFWIGNILSVVKVKKLHTIYRPHSNTYLFGDRVQRRSSLVKYQDRTTFKYSPGNGHSLFFTARYHQTSFAHLSRIPIRQFQNRVVELCKFGCFDYFGLRLAHIAIMKIVHN